VRATLVFLLASLVTMTGCVDNKKKMQQAQKKRDAEKKAREDREAARLKALTLFPLPFPNAKEANAFRDKEGLGLEARLVFTLGKIETDTKVKTSAMPLPDAGALQQEVDWGAGRLVHVELKSVRVATDFEKKLLAERH